MISFDFVHLTPSVRNSAHNPHHHPKALYISHTSCSLYRTPVVVTILGELFWIPRCQFRSGPLTTWFLGTLYFPLIFLISVCNAMWFVLVIVLCLTHQIVGIFFSPLGRQKHRPCLHTTYILEKFVKLMNEKLYLHFTLIWNKNELPLRVSFVLRGSEGKESTCSAGDLSLIPGSERSPGEQNDSPLQYSCLENSMNRGAWWATVHGEAKSWTWLSD